MTAPVLSWLFIVQEKVRGRISQACACRARIRSIPRGPQAASAQQCASPVRLSHPALRAIPFPKVTELFCRLPSATLFYRPEAANLGDLMRLWVRTRVKIKLLLGFSWAAASAPDLLKNNKLYQCLSLTSKQDVSKGGQLLTRKENAYRGLPSLLRVAHCYQ